MPDADSRQDRIWGLASSAQRAPGADIDFVIHASGSSVSHAEVPFERGSRCVRFRSRSIDMRGSGEPVELFLDSGVTGEIGISNQPVVVQMKHVHHSIF